MKQVVEWRRFLAKPIVNDVLEYEGNTLYPWGGISAEQEVHRFWIIVVNGGMPDTVKPTFIQKTFSGGPKVGCCIVKAGNELVFCDR